MDYKKKFEDFLNKMQGLLDSAKKQGHIIVRVEDIENTFPELKESEDERIRTAILNHLKKMWGNCKDDICGVHVEDAIAWLEKQGVKQSLPIPNERAWLYLVADVLTWENGIGQYLDDPRVQQLAKELSSEYAQKLYTFPVSSDIENNKQETDGKAEPKFHEGDWIVYNNDICQIVKREEGCNKLVTVFGIEKELVNERNLSTARLWAIEDAKEGDVLVCKGNVKGSNGITYERICLFKNLDNAFFTLTKTSNCIEEYATDVNIDYPDNTVPATKEQRDLLFQKMKVAGYVWDAEKKGFIMKTEPKFKVGEWITDGEKVWKIGYIEDGMYIEHHGSISAGGTIESIDKRYHLWTIQDAKDGDVLVDEDNNIGLYREEKDDLDDWESYIYLGCDNRLYGFSMGGYHNIKNTKPATKEQSDLLFKKIKEKGYKWDAEKKALKEIELHDSDKIEPKFKVGEWA